MIIAKDLNDRIIEPRQQHRMNEAIVLQDMFLTFISRIEMYSCQQELIDLLTNNLKTEPHLFEEETKEFVNSVLKYIEAIKD